LGSGFEDFLPHKVGLLLFKDPQDTMNKMSFKRHFFRGDNESILNGLEPALGMGLLKVRPLGLN
jgi:hypothetical protein